ncbi:MAG TPA: FecR domain-containing protein [Rhizomicrobium sp.]
MSGIDEAPACAKSVREAAAQWIARRDSANWSEADRQDFDAWLASSHAHAVAYLRAEEAWRRSDKLVALRGSDDPSEGASEARRFRPFIARGMIAAVLLSVLAAGAFGYFGQSNMKLYATPVGGRQTVTLADGSQITLNTDTALRVDLSGSRREVYLDKGEAYFRVTHDAAHPFLVMAGTRRITDLGTAFSVRRDDERLEVAVVEGKVAFDSGTSQAHSMALLPGDIAVATKTRVTVTKNSAQAVATSLSWRRGLLIFDNTALGDAAKEFNRYSDEKLVVADTAARLPVVGTFDANDSEAFARVARQVFGLLVKKRGDQIVISR